MVESQPRLIRVGLPQNSDPRRMAVLLVFLMLISLTQPASANLSVSRNDFGVLDELDDTLSKRTDNDEASVASQGAIDALNAVDLAQRPIDSTDPLSEASGYLDGLELRDSSPFVADHPRPYEFLMDASTQPDGWPYNLFETLFSVQSLGLNNPLGIGINTYAVYVNFSSRDNGPSHEAWVEGTFTGELLVGTEIVLFNNYIDIDGDSVDDLSVGLTIEGIITQGDGFGIELGDCGIPPATLPCVEEVWIRPTFQWKVTALNQNDFLWNNMSHLEVSLMKGLAFDLTLDDSESYAVIIDTRFTQPPHQFTLGVGLQKMTFSVNAVITNVLQFISSLTTGQINASALSLTSISAPYAIRASNPDADSSNRQSDCNDGTSYYDPILDHQAHSHDHKCGFGLGVGFIRFDGYGGGTTAPILETAYIDASFHPEVGETRIPNEVDITLRNDNLGQNTFDTVEIFSDIGADMYLHYFEDRSNTTEGDSPFGNVTDSRSWIRGLPSGTLHPDEIAAVFTMIGEEPGGTDLPGDIPSRLSMIIAIKNFSGDSLNNVDDPTLPVNPANPPNTLVAIVATESIDFLDYKSTFMRGGYASDSSSIQLSIANVPKVIIVEGSFEIPESGLSRVNYDNPNLNTIAQVFDNALLTIVEVILDVGDVVNGLPESIVGTAGATGGAVRLNCYNQVKQSLPTSVREPMEIGSVSIAISSSDQPWLPDIDHILLSEDTNIKQVNSRIGGLQEPLVPVAMSARIGGISSVTHDYDPINDVRQMELQGVDSGPFLIGHILHDDGDIVSANQQSATLSNRPSTFNVTQTAEALTYAASGPIGTITYGGDGDGQRNAIRLNGLPSSFQLILGDTVGYVAATPMESIEVQLTNATQPFTMDGDHFRFWVDEATGETSLSTEISDVTSIRRLSPLDPGANGPEGNSRIELLRSQSSPMNILLEDETEYDDSFKGMNGRIAIDPLPANITVAYPSGVDSSGLELPTFDEGDGVQALSFFLGDLVNFGSLVNDFVYSTIVDLGGIETGDENMSLGLDLQTGEAFDVTMDVRKGTNILEEPEWSHGIGMEVFEASKVTFNLSRMPTFTLSSRTIVNDALADYKISKDEYQAVLQEADAANISNISQLLLALEDGVILESEMEGANRSLWEEQGITYELRRSWHLRSWLPNLPPGRILLEYDFRMRDGIPLYEFDLFLEQWTPERQQMSIIVNGLEGRDMEIVIAGLDTSGPNNVFANTLFSTQDNLTVPRVSIDMSYDLGTQLDSVHAVFIDRRALSRVEALIVDVPQAMTFSSTVGDIFLIEVDVPPQYQIDGHSAQSLMIQQMRYVDGFWWPATVFMRDLPGEMALAAQPNSNFDIRADISFQGMMELDYKSNTDDMDLYLEATGRSVDFKGDVLLLAEDLPSTFVLQTTDDWGMRVASSGQGVSRLYIKQTDLPSTPGVTIDRIEVIGQDLKSATIHVYMGPFQYPVIVLDDITNGRIVASSEATIEPYYMTGFLEGFSFSGRAVLLDAQFTGPIPTASSFGVNGMVTDLSLIGSLTGDSVETRHILLVEPITTAIASGLALLW
tara:strand:- start:13389 stop:18071 length:4683 start_codon:yes stop_codon:yes gene_type:complete